jgi:hypothetical protein
LSSTSTQTFEISVDSNLIRLSIISSDRFIRMFDFKKFRNNHSRWSFNKTLLSNNCDPMFEIFSLERKSWRESMSAVSILLSFTKNFRAHESTQSCSRTAGKSAADSKTSLSISEPFTINWNDSLKNPFRTSESRLPIYRHNESSDSSKKIGKFRWIFLWNRILHTTVQALSNSWLWYSLSSLPMPSQILEKSREKLEIAPGKVNCESEIVWKQTAFVDRLVNRNCDPVFGVDDNDWSHKEWTEQNLHFQTICPATRGYEDWKCRINGKQFVSERNEMVRWHNIETSIDQMKINREFII